MSWNCTVMISIKLFQTLRNYTSYFEMLATYYDGISVPINPTDFIYWRKSQSPYLSDIRRS